MSQFGGGEILRAVLDASSVSKRPFFYSVVLNGADPALQTATRNAVLQLQNDSYFLMTAVFGFTTNAFLDQPEFIDIYDAANQQALINAASVYSGLAGVQFANPNSVYSGFLNDTLASCMTLPEYVLWAPNSLVGVTWMGRANIGLNQQLRYLVLAGIEFKVEGN